MKTAYLLIALSSLLIACTAQPTKENLAAAQPAPGVQQMEGRMRDMQALMDRIHNTKDPQERQRLMHEHMQAMEQGMTMLERMMRGRDDDQAQTRECAQADTECRIQRMQGQQQMMNQHMSMMRRMMGQLMQHDTEEPAVKPDDSPEHATHH